MSLGSWDRPIRLSFRFERALRLAAVGHRDQVRKGSDVPYLEHPFAVALILDRAGFDEETVIAGLLHDLVEDTDITLDRVRDEFGEQVAETVGQCSEVKLDPRGVPRPWIDRKRDHLAEAARASLPARAVMLADKLHNIICIRLDLDEGRPIWTSFHADRDQVLWYLGAMIETCRTSDPRVVQLADEGLSLLHEIRDLDVGNWQKGREPS